MSKLSARVLDSDILCSLIRRAKYKLQPKPIGRLAKQTRTVSPFAGKAHCMSRPLCQALWLCEKRQTQILSHMFVDPKPVKTVVNIRHAQIHGCITNRCHVGRGRAARVFTFNIRKHLAVAKGRVWRGCHERASWSGINDQPQ